MCNESQHQKLQETNWLHCLVAQVDRPSQCSNWPSCASSFRLGAQVDRASQHVAGRAASRPSRADGAYRGGAPKDWRMPAVVSRCARSFRLGAQVDRASQHVAGRAASRPSRAEGLIEVALQRIGECPQWSIAQVN